MKLMEIRYLDWANKEWAWFNSSGLINSQNLINDGLLSTCKNNGGTTWTYNQGVVLGGLVSLYTITNDKAYLVSATAIADATMSLLSSSTGILQETCEPSNNCDGDQIQFKGIFMRNLAYLYQATKSPSIQNYISQNTQSIWNNDRSGTSFGLKWTGPFDSADAGRQSSALDAFNAGLVL